MAATLKCDTIQNASSATANITLNTDGTTNISTLSGNPVVSGTLVMGSSFLRNRIINGAMVIDQRNAGASVSVGTATATYTLDRWRVYHDTAITSNITAQQSTTVPTSGYINSLILTNGTGASPASGDANSLQQRIEGLNCGYLNFGSSSAATVTISFWVRSSLTGTFGFALLNSAQNRSYVTTYSISAANTWEQKTITIAGDTTGTWLTTSGIGIIASWDLGSGTTLNTTANAWQAGQYFRTSACTNFIGTTGATFYITGVQLEVGSVATPFERRQYGQELALCQRYYSTTPLQVAASTDTFYGVWNYKVTMRTTPTISGGGAGFTAQATSNAETLLCYQTTRGVVTLTASAEL